MSLVVQYPTLAEQGLSEDQIRRVLISRNYPSGFEANVTRASELLFAAKGDLTVGYRLIDKYYPDAFRRTSDGVVPTRERLREQMRWSRTREAVAAALAREQASTGMAAPIPPQESEAEKAARRLREKEDAQRRVDEEKARAEREQEERERREREQREQAKREQEERERREREAKARRRAEVMAKITTMDMAWKGAVSSIGGYPYTLLYGLPGTGKTGTAYRILDASITPEARAKGARVVNISLLPETTGAEVMGFIGPEEGVGGAFRKWYGALAKAAINGWPVLINEIDDAQGDVETALLALLDNIDIAQYELTWGEAIKPAPGFTATATMNGDPAVLREALLDRFPYRFNIKTAHPDAILALPDDLQEIAYHSVANTDLTERHSLRAWHAFAEKRKKDGAEMAAYAVFGEDRWQDVLNHINLSK